MKAVQFFFVLLLVLVAGGLTFYFVSQKKQDGGPDVPGKKLFTKTTEVAIFVGGEKMAFLHNPEIQKLLADRHGIEIDGTKAGSIEMVRGLDTTGKDALWPSNDIAAEFFRMEGGQAKKVDIVFNSPIVIYTGWKITNALVREGIVEKRDQGYYIVKFGELVTMCREGKKWKDIGLQELWGSVSVRCTDPTRSNSGNMFSGLVANMMNKGDVVDEKSIETILPELQDFFGRLGMMEHSSGDIFEKFISTGINNSMVVGYENQLIEFVLANPAQRDAILKSVCILYPLPTVWSSHPVIALTDEGSRLIEALKDPEIQEAAWRMHGFRSGLMGVTQDPTALGVSFIPETIESVMPLPTPHAMEKIVEGLTRH